MSSYFTRDRFGSPQAIAAILLLFFLGQCLWFSANAPLTDREIAYVLQGQQQWHTRDIAPHEHPSPITGLVAALPLLASHAGQQQVPPYWRWLARAPFMLMGALFGASIWYVARRLYGNVAGYIALILYAFSPLAIVRASTVQPNVIASWGAFGLIFTAIGLAHTLYAPREVVLWNWKRILLLGIALGLASAAQLAVVVLIPVAIGFMWYLVPERRRAATVIMLAGCALGFAILFAAYGFHMPALAGSASQLLNFQPQAFGKPLAYTLLGFFLFRQPTSLLLLLIAISTYFSWKRARFFGTTAPLLVFILVLLLGMAMPHQGGLNFYILALPFSYVFIAGVMTDLLESKHAPLMLGLVIGVLLGHVVVSFAGLLRM